jgi:hypothetical protein
VIVNISPHTIAEMNPFVNNLGKTGDRRQETGDRRQETGDSSNVTIELCESNGKNK